MTIRAIRPFYVQGGPSYDAGDEILVDGSADVVALGLAADDTDPPNQSSTKDEWAAYRSAQGHDIEGLTKQTLIDLGGPAADTTKEDHGA